MFSTMCGLKATYAGLEGPAWGRLPQGNGGECRNPGKPVTKGMGAFFTRFFLVEPEKAPSIKKLPSMPFCLWEGITFRAFLRRRLLGRPRFWQGRLFS